MIEVLIIEIQLPQTAMQNYKCEVYLENASNPVSEAKARCKEITVIVILSKDEFDRYFTKPQRDAPLSICWKPSTQLPKKWIKRDPGWLRKIYEPQTVMIVDSSSDSEKENEPNNSTITGILMEKSGTAKDEVEKGTSMTVY